MRSVLVHLNDVKAHDVRTALSAFAQHQTSERWERWVYPPYAGHPSLYIELFTDFSEYEPDDFAILDRALGKRPDVSIIADVSGRIPGDAEVRTFVEELLTRF